MGTRAWDTCRNSVPYCSRTERGQEGEKQKAESHNGRVQRLDHEKDLQDSFSRQLEGKPTKSRALSFRLSSASSRISACLGRNETSSSAEKDFCSALVRTHQEMHGGADSCRGPRGGSSNGRLSQQQAMLFIESKYKCFI